MFVANLRIVNNTIYPIVITRDPVGRLSTVMPGNSYTNSYKDNHLYVFQITLNKGDGQNLMNGQIRFSPEIGVTVERGWIYDGDDTIIKMIAVANGKEFVQTTNGGRPLLNWDEFKQGGDILITYEMNN